MIGAGIFRSPGDIAEQLPRLGLYFAVWIIGGAYALLGANALAELGTVVPRSGGQYVFVREALGDYGGFVVGWSDWISTCGTTAAVAITLGEYALIVWPQFRAVQVIALTVIAVLTIVQWVGVRWGGIAQDATSFAKGIGFVLFIAACFWLGARNPAVQGIVPEHEGSLLIAFIVALQLVIYTYDGWSAVIYFSEEVKEPGRNIPRSMFGGVFAVMAIYLVLNVAFLRVVPLATIAREKLAVAVVAHHLFGFDGDNVTRMLAIVALLSAVNSNVLMAPRVVFAMSRDRLFWRGAAEVNRGGTPAVPRPRASADDRARAARLRRVPRRRGPRRSEDEHLGRDGSRGERSGLSSRPQTRSAGVPAGWLGAVSAPRGGETPPGQPSGRRRSVRKLR